jgi:hypothetical protein
MLDAGCRMSEDRRPKSDAGGRMPEVRSPKTEVRRSESEVGLKV